MSYYKPRSGCRAPQPLFKLLPPSLPRPLPGCAACSAMPIHILLLPGRWVRPPTTVTLWSLTITQVARTTSVLHRNCCRHVR